MPIGKRIYLKRELPDKELIEKFKQIPTADCADVMNRSCAMHPRIRLMSSPTAPIVAGPALTIRSRAGDNLMFHAALHMIQEGDVVVISNEGDAFRSVFGEVMLSFAHLAKKAAAIILDGPIRDIDRISQMDIPVYATGTTPGGPYKDGPGEINVPISCGNQSVNPGDIILADSDGIIVIPRKEAAGLVDEAAKFAEADAQKLKTIQSEEMAKSLKEFADKLLVEKGIEIIDDIYRP